jgi:UDP:flavonoid glycosyltransferase YjiC (YdhE family)
MAYAEAKRIDFESSYWPAQFHYTGPFHDGFGRIESNFPWNRLTDEPLIYASMGTLQNGLESVFTSVAEAVGTRPGMQLVLSIGSTSILKRSARCQPTGLS